MSTIYYGVAGEGRGHGARALALIEQLVHQHRVVVYSSGQALGMLRSACDALSAEIRELRPLQFVYGRNQKLSYLRTAIRNAEHMRNPEALIEPVARDMRRDTPDLVVTDFEPVLSRAAQRFDVPVMSIDHQHVLLACDPVGLPADLAVYVRWMSAFVRLFSGSGHVDMVVSSFFPYKAKPRYAFCKQAGVMLRRRMRDAVPELRGHLVAYVRHRGAAAMIAALRELGRPVHVYGLGPHESTGSVTFRDVDPQRFVDDLASADALITTAGNQLVGEALYLRKPVYAIPEPGNHEQHINAHFVRHMKVGVASSLAATTSHSIRQFLDSLPTYEPHVLAHSRCGNDVALRIIDNQLSGCLQSGATARAGTAIHGAAVNGAVIDDRRNRNAVRRDQHHATRPIFSTHALA